MAEQIIYGYIKYNSEFKEFLKKNHPVLFSWLETSKFNLSEIPPKEQRQILGLYKKFVEVRENWFKASRASSKKAPPILDEELTHWLSNIIKFFPDNYDNYNIKYSKPQKIIKDKAFTRLFPVFKHISKEFPSIMNILMKNEYFNIYIIPQNNEELRKKLCKGNNTASTVINNKSLDGAFVNLLIFLKEEDIFNEEELTAKTKISTRRFKHEIYHLIDLTAAHPDGKFVRKPHENTYIDFLNERLGGKLEEIREKQEKNSILFKAELEAWYNEVFCKKRASGKFSTEQLVEIMNKYIKQLISKHKLWSVTFFGVNSISAELGVHPIQDLKELFALALESYFYNKEDLKKFDPGMYDIVEKEILPDLR